MKTTIQQQIKAVQDSRLIVDYLVSSKLYRGTFNPSRLKDIYEALNDAGSTLAAINLNPELKKHFDTTGQ
jgi:hypothetical protein